MPGHDSHALAASTACGRVNRSWRGVPATPIAGHRPSARPSGAVWVILSLLPRACGSLGSERLHEVVVADAAEVTPRRGFVEVKLGEATRQRRVDLHDRRERRVAQGIGRAPSAGLARRLRDPEKQLQRAVVLIESGQLCASLQARVDGPSVTTD